MIYTLDGSARRNHGRQLASRLIEVFNSIWSGKVQQYSVEHRAGTERCVGHSFRRIVRDNGDIQQSKKGSVFISSAIEYQDCIAGSKDFSKSLPHNAALDANPRARE